MFSGCPSIGAPCVLPEKFVVSMIFKNQWMELHQTLVDGVVEAIDELIRF